MSDEKNISLLSRAWHAAVVFLGIAVAVWIAVKLILEVWWVLVILVAIAVAISTLIWWRRNRYW